MINRLLFVKDYSRNENIYSENCYHRKLNKQELEQRRFDVSRFIDIYCLVLRHTENAIAIRAELDGPHLVQVVIERVLALVLRALPHLDGAIRRARDYEVVVGGEVDAEDVRVVALKAVDLLL